MRIAQRKRGVGRADEIGADAESRLRQSPRSVGLTADGKILELIAEGDAVDLSAAVGEGVVEIDALAALLEREAGVNAGGGVGIVGVEDEISAGGDSGAIGEDELLWRKGIVGDAHARQINRG